MEEEKKLSKKEIEVILAESRKRFKMIYDMTQDNRDAFIKNMKFSFNISNGHWEESDIAARQEEKRPYLTAHKLGKFVAQVVNSERGLPDRDIVIPVDGEGDPKIAQIYNWIIEDIEHHSRYDEIIVTEGEYAVGGGYGFWRLITEEEEYSFNNEQRVLIKPILNPLNVFLEPKGRWAHIRETLALDEFCELYPDFKDDNTDFESQDGDELWYENEKIVIAEYFRRVPCKKTIAEIETPNGEKAVIELTEKNQGIETLRTKEINSYKIEWFKVTGNSILEHSVWVGDEIPIIEVDGHKIQLEGKTYKKALTSDAKDMNRAYNYWLTSLTEKVAMSPKAPFIVTSQQIKGHEQDWKEANIKIKPYLVVNPSQQGAPIRAQSPEVGQGEIFMLQVTDQNIKDTLGMYETSVGNASNERSGKAIDARASRSELGTYHFPDNLRRAKARTKRMLINIIPKIYDNERTMRMVGRKDVVPINQIRFDNSRGEQVIVNDLTVGRYDVRESNPMNPSIRQQSVANLTAAMQYSPKLADVILPFLFEFTDLPGMEKVVDALKKRDAQNQQQIAAESQAKIASQTPPDINSLL